MRLIMKLRGLSLLLVTLLCTVVQASAQERTYDPVTFHDVTDNLYLVKGGAGANSGVFIGEGETLLIDMKMNGESVSQVLAGIAERSGNPIQYLISTHSDRDHVGGNSFLPAGITIIAHENCRKEILGPDRDGNPSTWNNPDMAPFLPSITFTDRLNLYLGGTRVELWHFGTGHTTGDAVVYFPYAKTAFIGDQIFIGRPQLIHTYKGGNSFGHVANLKRMLAALTDAEQFCSGHNDPVGRTDVERHIEEMMRLQSKVRFLMDEGKTLEDIMAVFPEDESRLVTSIYTEIVNGHDTY